MPEETQINNPITDSQMATTALTQAYAATRAMLDRTLIRWILRLEHAKTGEIQKSKK